MRNARPVYAVITKYIVPSEPSVEWPFCCLSQISKPAIRRYRTGPPSFLGWENSPLHQQQDEHMSMDTECEPSVTDSTMHHSQVVCLCNSNTLAKLHKLPWLNHSLKRRIKKLSGIMHVERVLPITWAGSWQIHMQAALILSESHYSVPGISVPPEQRRFLCGLCGTLLGHGASWTPRNMVIWTTASTSLQFSIGLPILALPAT